MTTATEALQTAEAALETAKHELEAAQQASHAPTPEAAQAGEEVLSGLNQADGSDGPAVVSRYEFDVLLASHNDLLERIADFNRRSGQKI